MKQFRLLIGLVLVLLVGLLWYNREQAPRVIHMTVVVDAAPIIEQSPQTNAGESVLSPPQISVAQINAILVAYHSPASGKGQALYAPLPRLRHQFR